MDRDGSYQEVKESRFPISSQGINDQWSDQRDGDVWDPSIHGDNAEDFTNAIAENESLEEQDTLEKVWNWSVEVSSEDNDHICVTIVGLFCAFFVIFVLSTFKSFLKAHSVMLHVAVLTKIVACNFKLAFALALVPRTFSIIFSIYPLAILAEPLPSPISFLLISSLKKEPLTPSDVRLGLFKSETTNVSYKSGKVINKKMALSLSSKGGNPKSCYCERVLVKAEKGSTAVLDSSSCIHTNLRMR